MRVPAWDDAQCHSHAGSTRMLVPNGRHAGVHVGALQQVAARAMFVPQEAEAAQCGSAQLAGGWSESWGDWGVHAADHVGSPISPSHPAAAGSS